MSKRYVVCNQNQHYLGKDGSWLDGAEPGQLFRTPHHDAALNQLFEAILHDPVLRGEVVACDCDDNELPLVEVLNPIAAPASAADDADDDVAAASGSRESAALA